MTYYVSYKIQIVTLTITNGLLIFIIKIVNYYKLLEKPNKHEYFCISSDHERKL